MAGRTTEPFWGASSPVSSFMKVDLPAPFGPVRPYRRPAENAVVTSSKSTFDPNRIDTPLTEIIVTLVGPRESVEGKPLLYTSANDMRKSVTAGTIKMLQ